RRVDAAFARITSAAAPAPQETRRILRQRALAMAEAAPAIEHGATLEIAEFQLAHEHYAIETRFIREIGRLDNLTPLPCTPAHVMGIVNHRGEILSVVDLQRFFGLAEKGITYLDKLIVLESGTMRFGILADEIVGVRALPCVELDNARQPPAAMDGNYLRGITRPGLAVLAAGAR